MKDYKKIIIGNWKMNFVYNDILDFLKQIDQIKFIKNNILWGIAPPFTFLSLFNDNKKYNGWFGAQNCHHELFGQYTSSISVPMLKSINVNFCIVGHSECRKYLYENDDLINKKILNLLKSNITPILCIGETLEQNDNNLTKQVLTKQLSICLNNVSNEDIAKIIIAYEPIWAIGTGKSASSKIVIEIIKNIIKKWISNKTNNSYESKVLYGGSVNENNIDELLSNNVVDGCLIGGASLSVSSFSKMILITNNKFN